MQYIPKQSHCVICPALELLHNNYVVPRQKSLETPALNKQLRVFVWKGCRKDVL